MPRRVVFLDTSFIVALENWRDPHHERAKGLDRELLEERCLSTLHWGVLLEIGDGYARVGRRGKGVQLIDRLLNEDRYEVDREALRHKGSFVILKEVPVGVCEICGARYFDASVLRRVAEIGRRTTPPTQTIAVPVEPYAST